MLNLNEINKYFKRANTYITPSVEIAVKSLDYNFIGMNYNEDYVNKVLNRGKNHE